MEKYRVYLLVLLLLCIGFGSNAQIVPISTDDYKLMGYPLKMRYQKFETDTNYSQKLKRTSYIEDYELTFNENRKLIQRQHYIGENKDRYSVFTYDNISRYLLKEELFEANNKIVSTITHSYNYLGRLAEVVEVNYPASLGGANKVVFRQSYKWNEKGQLSQYTTFGDDASKQKTIEYYYGL